MSDTLANYSFLPWVRLGLGNEILESDFLGGTIPGNASKERPEIQVNVKMEASKEGNSTTRDVTKTVKVQGPGDVLGINSQSVIRAHPKRGVRNFETNNLAYLEFYEEDLPWRFTPAKPVGQKLRPWLYLVLLRENEFEKSNGGTPTPFINIDTEALSKVFCNERDTYALAHVHVLEDLGINNGNASSQLSSKLAKDPDLALSRVLSPRKLEFTNPDPSLDYDPNVYHGFLIPAFETGRLAGLGLDTKDIPAQQSSWTKAKIQNGTNPGTYPYYYTWSFRVDSGGDFETLAELLTARELPEDIGKREMDMSDMGYGIKPIGDDAIGYVEGAMRHPDYVTAPWPVSDTQLKDQLLEILNLSANLQDTFDTFNDSIFYSPAAQQDPIVVPPTYGQWHNGLRILNGNSQNWIHKLNLHPSNRAAAGLGVQVVQKYQEKFMEIAWEQIGEINEANQKIRESELMKRTTKALAVKKVFKLDQFDLINAAGKSFEMLKFDDSGTIKKLLKSSTVPTAVKSGTFLKVANNFTPTVLMSKDGKDGAQKILSTEFLKNLNLPDDDPKKISAAPKKKEPSMFLPAAVTMQAINTILENQKKSFMEDLTDGILAVNKVPFSTSEVIAKMSPEILAEQKERAEDILNNIAQNGVKQGGSHHLEITIEAKTFEERISEEFNQASYGSHKKILFKKGEEVSQIILLNHSLVIENRNVYKTTFNNKFVVEPQPGIFKAKIFKKPVRKLLPTDLDVRIRSRLNPFPNFDRKLASFFAQNRANNNKPIMAYPRFPIPMYDYLKEISPDYIIPNVSDIEPNTITLMETNREFIESFLMGMNHEFSRELLWREFPTDMRGSYFRHFWEYDNDPDAEIQPGENVEDYVDRIIEDQNLRSDIKEIHKWNKPLGKNEAKPGPDLVLLVKGDLLRKYPNTLVYAHKAKYPGNSLTADRVLDDSVPVMWPIVTGKLEPDVYFFGFELSQEEANGNRSDLNEPGWFFVLRERPGQISFGLDDLGNESLNMTPDNWDSVTWEHLTWNPNQQPKALKVTGANITLNNSGNGPRAATWGASSSDMAYILYQSPILFARHASTMLNDQ